jgi:hypothetical protein
MAEIKESYPIIYHYSLGYRTAQLLLTAKHGDIPVTLRKMWESSKSQFLADIDPDHPPFDPPSIMITMGQDQDVYQINPALRHFARMRPATPLYGSTFFEQTQVDDWLDLNISSIEPVVLRLARGGRPKKPYANDAERDEDIEELLGQLQILEWEWKTDDPHYMVGKNLTICDIALNCTMIPVHKIMFGKEHERFEKRIKKTMSYFKNFMKRAEVIEILGELKLGVDDDLKLDEKSDLHSLVAELKKIHHSKNGSSDPQPLDGSKRKEPEGGLESRHDETKRIKDNNDS